MTQGGAISPFATYLASFTNLDLPLVIEIFVGVAFLWLFLLSPSIYLFMFLERKICADVQMRLGPNRVGPSGFFQIFADTFKMFLKEDVTGTRARVFEGSEFFLRWGPPSAIAALFCAFGTLPLSHNWMCANIDGGLLLVVGALLLANLFCFWSSYDGASSWSILASFRTLSSISVFLLPVVLSTIPVILITGSTNLSRIIEKQEGMPWNWLAFHNPGTLISVLTLYVGLLVWCGRAPFELASSETELYGGHSSLYTGTRLLTMEFLSNFSIFVSCCFISTLFLGGGATPFDLDFFGRAASFIEFGFLLMKTFALLLVSIWVRWSFPRLNVDQVIRFTWKVLVPLSFLSIILTALWISITGGKGLSDLL